MIPIECPKCGRGGSVPPDRLNARLVCKACHTVFHLDNTGRMVLGDPESFDMKSTGKARRAEAPKAKAKEADFDPAEAWKDIPKPVKYGVPAALAVVVLFLYFPTGNASHDHEARGESIVQAVIANNRSRAVSLATPESADAAGKWFDLLHGEIEKSKLGTDASVRGQVFSGNPDKDTEIDLMVVVTKPGSSETPVTISLPMTRSSGSWLMDGTKSLDIVQKSAPTASKK
jgi:hypothetical protein